MRPKFDPVKLRTLRGGRQMTQQNLAALAGVNYRQIGFWERGVVAPSIRSQTRLAKALGIEVEALWERPGPGSGADRAQMIPLLGRIPAGEPSGVADHVIDWIEAPRGMNLEKKCYALEVRGESMSDMNIHDGDVIYVEGGAEIRDGDVAVACIDADEYTIKKVHFQRHGVVLVPMSADPGHKPIFVPGPSIEFKGKVVGKFVRF